MKSTHILVLLSLLCLTAHLKADDVPNPPLISITGSGEVKVMPDEVEVQVGIQLRDQSVDMLSKLMDKRASDVIKILRDEGVDDNDIETSNVSIQPYYASTSSSYGGTKPDYYIGSKSITFTLTNLTSYDTIMTQLYSAGINTVDSVIFKLSDELLEEKKFEARKKATANAKRILNTLVDGLELTIGNPYYISESTSGGSPQPYYGYNSYSNSDYAYAGAASIEEEASSPPSTPSVSGGEITISSTVSAQYYLV